MLIAATVLACSSTPTLVIVGVLFLGILYARNLEFMHAALHGTLLRGGRANRIVGALLGAPMLVSFELWRREHALHHRDVRREGFVYEYDRLTNLWELLLHLLMLRHLWRSMQALMHVRLRLTGGYTAPMLFLIGVLFASFLTHHDLFLTLWLLPLPIACIVHTLIELPEHLGLQTTSNNPFENSRILDASPLLSWLVLYNNYHAMHHAQPRIPIAHLAKAYRQSLHHSTIQHETYGQFFSRLIYGLVSQKVRLVEPRSS